MNPSPQPKDLKEWKERIKEKWDEQRKQVIFQGNEDIIYPTTLATERTTTQHITTPTTVNLTTHGNGKHEELGTANTEDLVKVIGITIASLLAFMILAVIVIRVCRRSRKNKNKRISLRRPLQGEDPDHIYAEIEPLRANDIESPSTSSGAVPLPTKKHKRRLGVSSMRYVSLRLGRLFGTGSRHSAAANEAIFFSKESESVRAKTLPSVPDFHNGNRRGKTRAARPKLPSSSRPLLDGDSQISSTSSDVLVEMRERENVYNPLTRQVDSGPYDHLKLGKTGSGAHITDEGAPGSPHDYFVLEREKGANLPNGDKKSNLYFILEKEEDRLDKDLSPKPTELESMEEDNHNTKLDTVNSISPKEKRESKKDHDYFVLETTTSSAGSEDGTGQPLPSTPQYQMNTESSRVSYELAKNVSNFDDNQSHSDDTSSSIPSSSADHSMHSEIHQKNDNPNYVCIESADNSVNNYDSKDSDITKKKNTSSDEYMEPVKLKTHSEYLEINPCVPERTTSKQLLVEKTTPKQQSVETTTPKQQSVGMTTSKQQSHLIGQLQNNKVS